MITNCLSLLTEKKHQYVTYVAEIQSYMACRQFIVGQY